MMCIECIIFWPVFHLLGKSEKWYCYIASCRVRDIITLLCFACSILMAIAVVVFERAKRAHPVFMSIEISDIYIYILYLYIYMFVQFAFRVPVSPVYSGSFIENNTKIL